MGFLDIVGEPDPASAARPQTVPEILNELASEGEPASTGFDPFDRQFRRGGLPPGTILVIGGPPHTGKTTLAEQIGLHVSKSHPVIGLFADEGSKPAARRLALMVRVPDHILDSEPNRAANLAEEALGGHSLTLWPTEAEVATACDIVAYVVRTFACREENPIIILDSIQTIPLNRDADPQSPRLAGKALVSQCRHWASAHGITFILTSQSNRQSYRSRQREENSEAIASFSETSAIEYMADVALVLSLPDRDSDIVDCRLVKNRLKGSAKPFSIRFSTDTYSMLEADQAQVDAAVQSAMSEKLIPYKAEIKAVLAAYPDISQRDLCERCKGDSNLVRQALKVMVNHDKTVIASPRSGRGGGFTYRLAL